MHLATRPNVLFITSDQHRADWLGCMGHPGIATPHLDQLARRGVVFERAMVDCPVCIPARTTLLTGRQSHRYGMPSFAPRHRIQRDRTLLLGGRLRAAGYQTEIVGKTHWHLDPTHRGGFDHVTGFDQLERERDRRLGTGWRHGIGANEFAPMLSHLPPELNSTHWAVDRSLEFLARREREQPFFLWTSFFEPHPPSVVHEPYFSLYRDEPMPPPLMPDWARDARCPWKVRSLRAGNSHDWLPPRQRERARQVYAGMITHIDHQIGRLLGALSSQGLLENTLIVYTSDHGESLGDLGTYFKGTVLAASARVPLIVSLPRALGGIVPRRSVELVALEDWVPTFCELAGVEAPEDVDGRSLLPLLRGDGAGWREEWHAQIDLQHAYYVGPHKYCHFVEDGAELVFNWRTDPREEHDLSADRALVGRLRERFISHLRAEGHEHLLPDGGMRNDRRTDADIDPANVLGWMALPRG
jgi:arylsulfatase A-like enzyme